MENQPKTNHQDVALVKIRDEEQIRQIKAILGLHENLHASHLILFEVEESLQRAKNENVLIEISCVFNQLEPVERPIRPRAKLHSEKAKFEAKRFPTSSLK